MSKYWIKYLTILEMIKLLILLFVYADGQCAPGFRDKFVLSMWVHPLSGIYVNETPSDNIDAVWLLLFNSSTWPLLDISASSYQLF